MNASVLRLRTNATRPSSLNKTTAETLMDWLWGTITHFPIQGDHRQYDGGTNDAEHQVQPKALPDGQQGAVIGLVRPQGAQCTKHHTGEHDQRGGVVMVQQPFENLDDNDQPDDHAGSKNAEVPEVAGFHRAQGWLV